MRIDASQQLAQVVVLAEERVKAAVHRHRGTVGQSLAPAADAATQEVVFFDNIDGSDDHHDVRAPTRRGRTGGTWRCGMLDAPWIDHRGAVAVKVCTMSRCQPGTVWLRTSVKPLRRKHSRIALAPSNAFTLRRRYW